MLCSKEEELNRTKATMNAIREERDRLRRRVSMPSPAGLGLGLVLRGAGQEESACRAKGSPSDFVAFVALGITIPFLIMQSFF